MKALGVGLGDFRLHDVEVVRDDDRGAPACSLHGRAAELAAERGVTGWLLTLTHTATSPKRSRSRCDRRDRRHVPSVGERPQ